MIYLLFFQEPYVCGPLNPRIHSINSSLSQITLYLPIQLIDSISNIDKLLVDSFYPITRLSCRQVTCKATSHVVEGNGIVLIAHKTCLLMHYTTKMT